MQFQKTGSFSSSDQNDLIGGGVAIAGLRDEMLFQTLFCFPLRQLVQGFVLVIAIAHHIYIICR